MGLLTNSLPVNTGSAQIAVDDRSRRVEKFNKAVTVYNACARTYIQNSRYDIERIINTVNAAVAEVQGAPPPQPPVGAGNLPPDFYPHSPCVNPDRAAIGPQFAVTDLKAMQAYNQRVASYNQQAEALGTCLKTYKDRARHDVEVIQAAVLPATVSAAPARATQAVTPPVESIVVTGARSQTVNHFVQAAATATHITGKVARWDLPICPSALGMPVDVTGLVVQRVKEVASWPACGSAAIRTASPTS